MMTPAPETGAATPLVRPPRRRRTTALALAMLMAVASACGEGSGEGAGSGTPGPDSTGAPVPALPGITGDETGEPTGAGEPGAESRAEDGPGAPVQGGPESDTRSDSVPGDPGATGAPSQAGDTTAARPASPDTTTLSGSDSLRARLDRIEAENDSLRAALGALLTTLTSGDISLDSALALQAEPDSARGILGVGTENVQHWGLRIFAALVFIALIVLAVRGVVWLLDRLAERNAARRLLFKRLVPVARILIWTLGLFFVVMVIFQVDTQGLVAAGAAIGVAVGFAAQDILKNVFGGFIVLFDQPFQVGDKISIGDTYGEVVSIGLRSTRIVTPDDNLVSVPNAQVVGDQVANANAGELNCQVVTDLWLPGSVDAVRAREIAFEAATSSRYLFRNKPVVVLVKDEFRETFLLHVVVKAYVLDPRMEFLFRSDVTERARAAFREEGLIGPMHGARAWVELDRLGDHRPGDVAPGEVTP